MVVLTSMPEHGDLAEQALAAGHHVLVEKPMSLSLEQAARLVELDRSGPANLLCAPHVLLSPDYQRMARMMLDGRSVDRCWPARGTAGTVPTGVSGSTVPAAARCSISGSTT